MFSYLWNRDFSAHVPSYFMKDDHDTLANDCYPGQSYGDLSFSEGVRIFAEQTPMSSMPYRRFRWGADLEIWLLEGRDFRSPNRSKDGPEKSILGEKQKAWLKEGLRTSNATFKLVISPGPVVGPDKAGKKDNHSNHVFQHEGDELRSFLASISGTLVVCGDRHWQYSSIDPKTGLREFGTGSINRAHDFGGATGFDPKYHRYWSRKGGYLSVLVEREAEVPSISFRYHDIDAAVQGEGEMVPISHRERLYLRDGEWVSDLVEAVVDVDQKPHRKRKLKTSKKKNKKDKL
jgi:alkaline phosphatase D